MLTGRQSGIGLIGLKIGPMLPKSGLKGSESGRMRCVTASMTSTPSSQGAQAELTAVEDLAATAVELQRALEAAEIAQREAEADAAELRQAEATRQGRGRWARLRQAWRGQ